MSTKTGFNLANAYVTLIPTLQGAQGNITKQIVPAAEKAGGEAGEKAGKSLTERLTATAGRLDAAGKKVSEFGGSLTRKITTPASLAAAAVGGIAVAAGWKRLVGIDTARGQFKGLGYDADAVMKQVDAGVTGTALSMAEGASAAVSILATGGVPLEGLEAQIQRVANVSAAYGVDASQANYLLNNVLTKQKVTWGDLSQMQQNQIPIVTALADEFGYTAEEIQKMAGDGEISIDMLNQALDSKAGAAAEEYAKTWEGVTANIRSNLGRVGAQILGEIFPKMQDGATKLLDLLRSDRAKEFASTVGKSLGDMADRVIGGIKSLIGWWNDLSPAMQGIIVKAGIVAVAAGPVLMVVGKIISFGGTLIKVVTSVIGVAGKLAGGLKLLWGVMAANPVGAIIAAVAALAAGLVWFFTKTETGKKIWSGFVDLLKSGWESYGQPVVDGVRAGFTAMWENGVKPAIDFIGDKVSWLWQSIIKPYFDFIIGYAKALWSVISTAGEIIGKTITVFIAGPVLWLWNNVVKPVLGWITDRWNTFRNWFSNTLAPAVSRVITSIGGFFKNLYNSYVKPVVDGVTTTVDKIRSFIVDRVLPPVKTAMENMGKAFNVFKDTVKTAMDAVKSAAAKPINFVINTVYTNGLKKFVDSVASELGLSLRLPNVSPIKLNRGGMLPGFGGGDRRLALLEDGEFVINKHATREYAPLLAAINGGWGTDPGTVGGSGLPGYSKGGFVGAIGSFFGDVARGIGGFLRDPLGAVAELITKPVEALLGGVDGSVWGDLAKGGVRKILSVIPDWFKSKSETIGNAGLVSSAQRALGFPYVWGGSSMPPGLDCSGLVYWAAQQMGLRWPRLTAAGYQSASSRKSLASAVPGDLLFWGNPAHHVGIYSGPGQMIHAPSPGTYVSKAAIYGNPTVGTYGGGGGGAGLRSTYAGLVESTARRSSTPAQFARNLYASQYDSGGYLQPGYTLAFNGTGKPEPVFTSRQWDRLERGRSVHIENVMIDPSKFRTLDELIVYLERLGLDLDMAGVGA